MPGELKSPPLGTLKWGGTSTLQAAMLGKLKSPYFKHKSGGVHAGPTQLYSHHIHIHLEHCFI